MTRLIGRPLQMPAAHTTGKDIHQNRKIDELLLETDMGSVNGLITNDKFCTIRRAKLKLRAQPGYPLCCHPAYQPDHRYPSDETFHPGGNHETSKRCVRRELQPYPDGQQRWDRVYQYLLRWTINRERPLGRPQEAQETLSSIDALTLHMSLNIFKNNVPRPGNNCPLNNAQNTCNNAGFVPISNPTSSSFKTAMV
jgi:hypothetical protein